MKGFYSFKFRNKEKKNKFFKTLGYSKKIFNILIIDFSELHSI